MEKKNHLRRNKWNIILLITILAVSYLAIKKGLVSTDNIDRAFQLNILTINSIFAGFLFTSLGIMASIVDKRRIAKLETGGYMDNYFNAIYIGLYFHIISIVIAVISILNDKINSIKLLLMVEQLAMLAGIFFFIKSVLNILKIIKKVRNSDDQWKVIDCNLKSL